MLVDSGDFLLMIDELMATGSMIFSGFFQASFVVFMALLVVDWLFTSVRDSFGKNKTA